MNMSVIDHTKRILPILWKFLDNCKNCSLSLNITKIDDEIVISLIKGKKIKRFKISNNDEMLKKLELYLKVY